MIVAYAPRALRDLEDISHYLTDRNPTTAAATIAAVHASITTLTAFRKSAASSMAATPPSAGFQISLRDLL